MNKKPICLSIVLLIFWISPVTAGESCYVETHNSVFSGFVDDLAGAGLNEALTASISYYMSQPPERQYQICGQTFTSREMAGTLQDFSLIYRSAANVESLRRTLQERFEVCLAAGGDDRDGRILVTGYFEPTVAGSLVREPPYSYPLYRVPSDLVDTGKGIGRLKNGRLVPYWTRGEIEKRDLLAGHELVYLKDRIEAFILHIQGSGKVRLPDGRIMSLQFAAKNGLPYRSIGKLLVETGKMELGRVTMPAIIKYLKAHPQETEKILNYNESYVFFQMIDNGSDGPVGSLGRTLIPGRSVALDQECFTPGALAFLVTRKPIFNHDDSIIGWAPLKRFVVNLDTGSAIRGSGRLDLFTGRGVRARAAAGNLKSAGRLYFLVPREL